MGIREHKPHACRARCGVHIGVNEINSSPKFAARVGIHAERGCIADSYAGQVVLEDLGEHPNSGQVRDGIEPRIGLYHQVRESISLRDVTGSGRIDFQGIRDLTCGFEPRNLALRDAPLL